MLMVACSCGIRWRAFVKPVPLETTLFVVGLKLEDTRGPVQGEWGQCFKVDR